MSDSPESSVNRRLSSDRIRVWPLGCLGGIRMSKLVVRGVSVEPFCYECGKSDCH